MRAARRSPRFGFLALGLALSLVGCAQYVSFPSASPYKPVTVSGMLSRPRGTGPFPAIVLLHTCGGVRQHVFDWASCLKAEGYVALVVDSFSPRGISRCGFGKGEIRGHVMDSAQDALGAVAHLRSLPFVEGDRIAVMGFSLGAMAAVELAGRSEHTRGGIRAAVAFYPKCGAGYFKDARVPVLFLLGELDNWTPASECVEKAKELREKGRTVVWKVYPAAHHGFDQAELEGPVTRRGRYTLEYNPKGTAHARKRVRAFLDQHLRGAP